MGLRTTIFALTHDRQMARIERAGLRARREELLAGAKGDVLEIGAGTGWNLPHYRAELESLTFAEPEPSMIRRLKARARRRTPRPIVLRAPAEDLPFDDNRFDCVVSTLVLCGVSDQPRALREISRVLRPGGRLLLIEHVRSDDPSSATRQDRMNGLNRFLVGCECNRPTLESLRAAGFSVTEVQHLTMARVPFFVSPLIVGQATTAYARVRADSHSAHNELTSPPQSAAPTVNTSIP